MEITDLSGGIQNTKAELLRFPFRMLVAGASGSGKSNMVKNLLLKYIEFDKIYIYSKHLDDKMYIDLKHIYDKINKKIRKKLKDENFSMYEMTDDFDTLITNEQLDGDIRNLIVIDDFMIEGNKSDTLKDLFISCRHKNTSIIYIVQAFHKVDKDVIRKNCNYFALFRVSQKKEIGELAKNLAYDLAFDDFVKAFTEITSRKYGFMVIDRTEESNDYPPLKYRDGWDGLLFFGEQNNI